MMHTCPLCGNPCGCEEEELYGDCCHACDEWKANPDVLSPTGWDGLPLPPEVED